MSFGPINNGPPGFDPGGELWPEPTPPDNDRRELKSNLIFLAWLVVLLFVVATISALPILNQ